MPSKPATSLSRNAALLGLFVLLGTACSADGMADKFHEATSSYNRSLRWGDYDRAAAHLPAQSIDAFIDSHFETKQEIVVLDYEIIRMKLDKVNGIAADRVQLSWHTKDELFVKETTVDQLWQYHDGRWVLVDERRQDGEPVAFFAEPPEESEEGEPVDKAKAAHPYLPGLQAYRKMHALGLSDTEKRKREAEMRKQQRVVRRQRQAADNKLDKVESIDDVWTLGEQPSAAAGSTQIDRDAQW